jgi:hypothetical protein
MDPPRDGTIRRRGCNPLLSAARRSPNPCMTTTPVPPSTRPTSPNTLSYPPPVRTAAAIAPGVTFCAACDTPPRSFAHRSIQVLSVSFPPYVPRDPRTKGSPSWLPPEVLCVFWFDTSGGSASLRAVHRPLFWENASVVRFRPLSHPATFRAPHNNTTIAAVLRACRRDLIHR